MRRRKSGLDRLIYRFQDRWETNASFRATVSGVLGLVMVIALCSCMGVVTTVANNAIANVNAARNAGVSGNVQRNTDTGVGQIKGVPTFPTSTVPSWQPGSVPTFIAIPDSQTPIPTATLAPTATAVPTVACTSNCGGGGGGGGGGGTWTVAVSGTPTPATWVRSSTGSFTVHTSVPGVGLAIVIKFPGGGTVLYENGEMTDSSGNYTTPTFTVPGSTIAGNADVWIQAHYNGLTNDSFHFPVPCQA